MTRARLNADIHDGSTGITTLGTVATGTWQGTTVAVNQGGTGAATHTANNVMIGAGTSALTSIAPGADGQVLTSTGSVWQSEAAAGGGKLVQASKGAFGHHQLYASGVATDQDTDAEGIAMTAVTAGNLIIANVSGGYAYYKRTVEGTTGMHLFYLGFIDSSNTTTTFEKYQTYYNRTNDFVFSAGLGLTAGFIVPSGCTAIKVIRKIENLFASSIISWASSTDDSLTHCIIWEVEQ